LAFVVQQPPNPRENHSNVKQEVPQGAATSNRHQL